VTSREVYLRFGIVKFFSVCAQFSVAEISRVALCAGTIVTVGKLDYERQHIYRLRIRARNGLSRAHADVEVEIRVTDVNDNSPVFTQPSYSVNLLETTSVGHQIVEVQFETVVALLAT